MSCRWLLNRPYGFITSLISFRRLLSLSFFIPPGIYARSRSLAHRGQGSNRGWFEIFHFRAVRTCTMSSDIAYSFNFNCLIIKRNIVDETCQLDKHLILRHAESSFTFCSICVFREASWWCLHPLDGRWYKSFQAGDSSTNCMRTLRVRIIQGSRAFQLGTLHWDGALCRISTEKGSHVRNDGKENKERMLARDSLH